MKRPHIALATACLLIAHAALAANAADLAVTFANPAKTAFPLVSAKTSADIFTDAADFKVVQIAAGLLATDIQSVSTIKPHLHTSAEQAPALAPQTVFVGTLHHSPAIDAIIQSQKIDVSAIDGKWESYIITSVPSPAPGVDRGLLIIGSDRRGTAYGVFDLSEKIGVSPWNWWADVAPAHHENLYLSAAQTITHGPPSVKYRGIFLNDEDWGLQPWAAKTFEPETRDIGPKTYARIFELLLRLKANFCWPAMHDVTKAFNIYPQNKQVADDYAIVMGSSHCEPMLRNNVSEWTDAQGRVGQAAAASFNWVTNSQGILDYWTKRLTENGKFENVYTLGLRGIHDGDMAGGGTNAQKATRLNEIIKDQRSLIEKYVNPDASKVPQIFCPYKEVLLYYQAGAIPPEDVTLVWADDNHGYIRQLSTPAEQKRSGGAGVYYHLSYWGRPQDYLWLESTPPALIWEELSKAYDYNAKNLWIVNVGDLKPAEIGITMAMTMAYDMSRYNIDNLQTYLQDFATATFGPDHAAQIADILNQYYHLNYQRKPEHMGFNANLQDAGTIQGTEFSDQEITDRLAAFDALLKQTNALYAALPKEQQDSFFELIAYPVRGSTLQNQKILYMDINRRAAARGQADLAKSAADKSTAAYNQLQTETAYFNNNLAGGKWKNMMSDAPRNQDVFKPPHFATVANVTPPPIQLTAGPGLILNAPPGTPFVSTQGYLSIAAEHFTRNIPKNGGTWKIIHGLGRQEDSVAVYPTTTPSADPKSLAATAPALEYDFFIPAATPAAKLRLEAIPTHRINPQRGLRYAVAIDNDPPQIIDMETPENSATWSTNVLRASAFGTTTHNISAGKHTLHLYMVDPGIVADYITIDLGGLPQSYLPPPETRGSDAK